MCVVSCLSVAARGASAPREELPATSVRVWSRRDAAETQHEHEDHSEKEETDSKVGDVCVEEVR